MELPQSRPFGAEGRKPTHDFLSLYSHSTAQQDSRPPPSQGGFLKTHDFLQVGKINAKEESKVEISSAVEKPPPPSPPPAPSSSSVEHILPGGVGTYSISHVSYFGQKIPKPEGAIFNVAPASSTEKNDENSNCSSYTGSGFTLWEETAGKEGKTGKENSAERPVNGGEATAKVGQWASRSSSNNNSHRNSFNSLSYSQSMEMKSPSFVQMIKSAKISAHDEDEFILKKENSSKTTHKGEWRVKVEGKSSDQKPNTPRSKHSATEQRRRSKINDRFQMLRELIPHSDHKRDKASFLLEVIEYIQFLQETVHKYEGPYVGWNQEPTKLTPWRTNHFPVESYVDQSQRINNGSAVVFAAKFDETRVPISPAMPVNPVESDISTATAFQTIDPHPGITNKATHFPMSLQPNCYTPVSNGRAAPSLQPRLLASDAENTTSQPQALMCQARTCTGDIAVPSDKLKEQELTVEGGTINVSTVYSQGLLNTLTQALQSRGVDLSHARVSVQIDLGKRAAERAIVRASNVKDDDEAPAPGSNQRTTGSRDERGGERTNSKALKKRKINRS